MGSVANRPFAAVVGGSSGFTAIRYDVLIAADRDVENARTWLAAHGAQVAAGECDLATLDGDERAATGRSIETPRRSAALRAPAKPGLSIETPRRSAALRAPAKPGLSIETPRRSAALRAPAKPGLSIAAPCHHHREG